jgi:hypothetical protein
MKQDESQFTLGQAIVFILYAIFGLFVCLNMMAFSLANSGNAEWSKAVENAGQEPMIATAIFGLCAIITHIVVRKKTKSKL